MAPFAAAIIILIVIIASNVSSNFDDILVIWVAFILPLFLIGFFMLYIPQQYKTLIIFDIENNILRKVKKKEVQIFNLGTAESIISKTIRTNFGCKYNLILKDTGNSSHIIFNENTPFGIGHWEVFSKKLSTIIGLPLKKEYWVKNLNGKFSLIPNKFQ